ncbi:MAG: apolipoprotein N-acyltransferase [Pseudomonadota bacterium]
MRPDLARVPPWATALAAGLAAALAHPPFGLIPGLAGYPLLLWLLDRADAERPLRSAFWRAWLAGVAYFGLSTWWIAEAFLVDIVHHGWMAPFAVTLMATGVALFWGLAGLLYRLSGAEGPRRVLVFAGLLAACEWLRGHVLTGFPWNLPGETWRAGSAMSQTAALVGAYGLTWITLVLACAPLLWREGRRGRVAVGLAAAAFAGLFGWGALRAAGDEPAAPGRPVSLRIVQADIEQSAKYDPALFQRIVEAYVGLTARPYPGGRPADLVIWPEGAIPADIDSYLAPGTWTRKAIEGALRPGQTLLVGAYRVEGTQGAWRFYNSLAVARRTETGLTPGGVYDKHRLVPFGEYLPLEPLMTAIGFKTLVHVGDGFSSGPRPRPLTPPGLPAFQPLICYESLYPGFTRAGAIASGVRPDFIVNLSNDAWFGATSGPLQHLNLASYRAIEEGVPMIRATPTGVSLVVDASGAPASAVLRHGERGVIDAVLPARRFDTPYRRMGDLPFALMLLISGGAFVWFRVVGRLNYLQNRK